LERLKERLGIAQRALQSLEELLVIEKPSRIERDAAIQRFEYTFEAAWKAAERFLLVVEGVAAASPKACMRISREAGLLSEEQAVVALEMVDDRNLTVHTHNEQLAERIHRNLVRYGPLLRDWLSTMNDRLADQ
jgi:nucleotidyltransferase substrate binding protein (TIGR01987 family)